MGTTQKDLESLKPVQKARLAVLRIELQKSRVARGRFENARRRAQIAARHALADACSGRR